MNDLAGLSQRQPITELLTVFLLSLIGVPLKSGFFGKFYVFKAAIDANLISPSARPPSRNSRTRQTSIDGNR